MVAARWQSGGRVGGWKLVAAKGDPWALYDLKTDRAESQDLAQQQPEKAKQLESLWNRQVEAFLQLTAKNSPRQNPKKRPAKSKTRDK